MRRPGFEVRRAGIAGTIAREYGGRLELEFTDGPWETRFHRVARLLEDALGAEPLSRVEDYDQAYWDYRVGGAVLTLASDADGGTVLLHLDPSARPALERLRPALEAAELPALPALPAAHAARPWWRFW